MNFSLYIAKRYLFSKKSNNTITIITWIAALGTIIVSAALFVVLSGFLGLKNFSVQFLNLSDPDIKITATQGKSFLMNDRIREILKSNKKIAHFSKVVEERAFFEYNQKTHIASIKGVDKEYLSVIDLDTVVYQGTWLDTVIPKGVVIGNGIANTLSMGVFNYDEALKIYVPKPGKGYILSPKNSLRTIHTQPIGIYQTIDEMDYKYVFATLSTAQQLLGYEPNQIYAIELKVTHPEGKESIAQDLQTQLGNTFEVKTREQLNEVFYKMLNTENLVLYLIFTLIVIIALFNTLGAIIMMILEKQESIKTLYNLGASINSIRNVFVLQGFLLTLVGLSIGLIIGVILVFAQKHYQMLMITEHLPYPVEFSLSNVFIVFITVASLGFITSKIAGRRVFKA